MQLNLLLVPRSGSKKSTLPINDLTHGQYLIPSMSRLMKELKAIIIRELRRNNIELSKEQVIVLKWLHEQDGRPQNDLALVTSRDKTSLTRLLAKMESKQLIVREKSRLDKRINLVFITLKGRKELERALPVVIQVFKQAMSGIDSKRIELTKSLFKDIYNNMHIKYEEQ